ncbi:putative splicing factor 3B subunit 3 [Hortaea werneckii]|nr:putative splicing factor 3B subunit 3 [Hortaea werneckii]KAI7000615.1 putative splicing factor 3B subunit 3 [Hortaea werneckii]KAI7052278.1 putative splicing factor 3B subunit 3 [Hortaea werneckii]KAI7076742.1 putative splicing factor 3B subunit 3 [Hortaea werneckii]KAI7137709.1 putative splicing factor 3B subunit 3 [Hortaea werneckii]
MANVQQTQSFYSLTLTPPSAPSCSVTCNAIPGLKTQDQQIFEARGQRIYLHRIVENEDRSEVKLSTVLDQDVFGIIRGVSAFRIPGTATDQLVVSSDSGRMSMLNYDADKNAFRRVHLETFGKSGVRRTVPGQYVASDPRGRCLMLASTEKNKVVYMVNREPDSTIRISSPHEANQWASLCFGICALDTGWEHPIFAALEVDYSEAEADSSGIEYERREKHLVYYTVDLGLNHVIKSWSDTVDYSANKIFGVPGGQDGPSGVLVCCEGRIYYRHDKAEGLSIPIPRRSGPTEDPERKRIIVSGCLHLSKARHEFFFLLQTEDGDVFKLTLDMAEDAQGRRTSQPVRINLKYYETFPVAKTMLLIRKGYIYTASEHGDSKLYHVNDLAEDMDFEPHNNFSSDDVSPDPADAYTPTFFKPRGLTFTSLATTQPSLHPLMKTKVDNLTGEDAPQIYAIQGSGANSRFKTLRHGLEVQEIVSSPLGNIPFDNLWSLRHRASDDYHSYLLLSSAYGDKTIVLSIGDEVETMEDSPFLTNRATVTAQTMGDATLVQVHARGVLSILESGAVNEWPSPAHRTIVAGSANSRQLLLGLSSSELAFFFMGDDGVLNQLEEMPEMSGKITALAVGATPPGQLQAKFAVVGCDDCTIRVMSIELDSPLEPKSVQALSAMPTSIEVVSMRDPSSGTLTNYVHIGLQSGLYLRATIDEVTGELGEVRTKFLGARPTRLFPVDVPGQAQHADDAASSSAILAASSRPWLGYNHPVSDLYTLAPLVTSQLEAARPFASEHLKGLCAVQGGNLLIFGVEGVEGGLLSSKDIPLRYTPRAMSRNPWLPVWYVAQAEGNTLSEGTKKGLLEGAGAKKEEDGQNGAEVKMEDSTEGEMSPAELDKHLGLSRAPGHWASCVQVVDPTAEEPVCTLELGENEAALCCAAVPFESKEWDIYLAVGTGQHLRPGEPVVGEKPKGYVHIYRISEEGRKIELVHKTPFPTPIYALHPFHGRLAIGVGNELFIYDLGLKSLLRKSRGTVVPNLITSIDSRGNRLICADISESLTFIVFKPAHNRLIPFVDDTIPRWSTALSVLDYETAAGADKFGNLFVLRVPEQASKESDEEGVGGYISNERSYLNGTPYRLDLRAHVFTNDIPTSIQRTPLVPGGQDVLFFSGLQGTMGILVPFVSREDVEFFAQLEMLLRAEDPPLAGRDHLMFKGYYVPLKGVVDGDLCERFLRLGMDSKVRVAAELEREVKEVERKVLEVRGRVACLWQSVLAPFRLLDLSAQAVKRPKSMDPDKKIEEETVPNYDSSGYYPVQIRDVFQNRDHHAENFKVLKICIHQDGNSLREQDAYAQLFSGFRTSNEGLFYTRIPQKRFEVTGPSGYQHACFVFVPAACTLWEIMKHYDGPMNLNLIKYTVLSAIKALDFLHSDAHLIHTDVKLDNMFMSLTDDAEVEVLASYLVENPPEFKVDETGRKIYQGYNLRNLGQNSWGHAMLGDLGEAYVFDEGEDDGLLGPSIVAPAVLRPPEVILGMKWGTPLDIWQIGCLFFLLLNTRLPFQNFAGAERWSGCYHLTQMTALMGPPPEDYLARSEEQYLECDETCAWRCPGSKGVPDMSFEALLERFEGEDKTAALDFVRCIFHWKPEERSTAKELLQHPFLNFDKEDTEKEGTGESSAEEASAEEADAETDAEDIKSEKTSPTSQCNDSKTLKDCTDVSESQKPSEEVVASLDTLVGTHGVSDVGGESQQDSSHVRKSPENKVPVREEQGGVEGTSEAPKSEESEDSKEEPEQTAADAKKGCDGRVVDEPRLKPLEEFADLQIRPAESLQRKQ